MRKRGVWALRRLAAVAAAAAMALTLAGCGGNDVEPEEITALVRGNLNVLYKVAEAAPEDLERMGIDAAGAQTLYEQSLVTEAAYFAHYYGMENRTEEQDTAIRELCGKIYEKADYTVGEAVRQQDGSFQVEVRFRPLDIHVQVDKEFEDFRSEFLARYKTADPKNMTDEKYEVWLSEYWADWNSSVLELVNSKLEGMGYQEETSVTLTVQKGEDGLYSIDQTGFDQLDMRLIAYP